MDFLPHTEEDRRAMLAVLGLDSIDQLFREIPAEVQFDGTLSLPPPMSESELLAHLQDLSRKNAPPDEYAVFLGGGAYDHYVPAVVKAMLMRGEFYTAYTPYQAEISQGTLQAIYEYQTMVCELTGMDVANASMYDGATALAEAAFLAHGSFRGKRQRVLVSRSVHPESREVLRTYAWGLGLVVEEIPFVPATHDTAAGESHIGSGGASDAASTGAPDAASNGPSAGASAKAFDGASDERSAGASDKASAEVYNGASAGAAGEAYNEAHDGAPSGTPNLVSRQMSGATNMDALEGTLGDDVACVICQQPNFFGVVEDVAAISAAAARHDALSVVSADPVALGLLEAPGKQGADVVVGEGQPLGNPLNFGGPYLGLFATREKFLRQMPGRISGSTVDRRGNRGFVLTLQAREQHIRRQRATSNICSNEALNALAATVYLAWIGPAGLRELARLCLDKAHYLASRVFSLPGFRPAFPGAPFFKEFAVKTNRPVSQVLDRLREHKVLAGPSLERYYPELKDCFLLAATERRTREEMDRVATLLEERGNPA